MNVFLNGRRNEKLVDLKTFIMEIIKAVPKLDNEIQDYYENICNVTDFFHDLAAIYLEENEIVMDYWSTTENSTMDIIFKYENHSWILKNWNGREVPTTWHGAYNNPLQK